MNSVDGGLQLCGMICSKHFRKFSCSQLSKTFLQYLNEVWESQNHKITEKTSENTESSL